jgi:hypothetical protein
MYTLYRQWFAFRPLEGSHLDRLVNANRCDRQQKKQDYSHTSEIGRWAAELATSVSRLVAANSPIRGEETRLSCDVRKGIRRRAQFADPKHGGQQASNQPEQLLCRTATENVHIHVHHMTGYARREAKRKRREE